MPVFQRKQLRHDLGTRRLNTTTLGTTQMGVSAGSALVLMDPYQAVPDLTQQSLYVRSYVRVASYDYRVGSFNIYSGGFVSVAAAHVAIASGADFEVSQRLSATDLDGCIDAVVPKIRVREEITMSSVDGLTFYPIDGAASPNVILEVLDAWMYANPSSTTNRCRNDWREKAVVALTATGRELRIPAAMTWSQQVVMDCLLQLSLGSDDAATLSIPQVPDDAWLLDGAAAQAYDLLIQKSPSQETTLFKERRKEMGIRFTRASAKYQPDMDSMMGFEAPF